MGEELFVKEEELFVKEYDCCDVDGFWTLSTEEVVEDDQIMQEGREYTKTHDSGWTITAKLNEDYFFWVGGFVAWHPVFGQVAGNFETRVFADSQAGFEDFVRNHPLCKFDM